MTASLGGARLAADPHPTPALGESNGQLDLPCWLLCLTQTQKAFSIKDQTVNILGFAGQMIPVTVTQFSHCSKKAAIDRTKINERHYAPIKLHLWTQRSEFHMLFM